MKLKCPNEKCLYEWDYKGNAPFITTCPRCQYKVRLHPKKKITNNHSKE